ncbi:MAG TPA: S9 family peptidase [Ktedonobacteraceae bacterium]|nr:S9 family peptidase [Ktedonobacteraceae bacterium]
MARKLTLDDLWTLKTLGKIALSPDGRRVAFEVHTSVRDKNETCSAIWLLHLDEQGHAEAAPRQLTGGNKNDTNPVWASDSRRLLFLSNREGDKSQLWLIESDGGEACRLTSMQRGVSEVAWSPDGNWIAFTATAASTDDEEVLVGRKALDEAARKQAEEDECFGLRTITTAFYRWDGRGLYEQFAHLFVMPAPPKGTAAGPVNPGTIRRLTAGDFDHELPEWTPDSLEISCLCNRNENRHAGSRSRDLWTIDLQTGQARCLTNGTLEIECYAWSPDGNSALVVGADDQMVYTRSVARLHLVARREDEGERVVVLTPDLDNPTAAWAGSFNFLGLYRPQWSHDGQQVYFLVTERGCVNVYRMDVQGRTRTCLTAHPSVTGFLALLPGERGLLLVQEQPDHPWELYLCPLTDKGTGELEPLTHLHDALLSEVALGKTERLHYQGANGDDIDGWLIHPVGMREGVRYPLMVHIHGGPHWAYGVGIDLYYHYFAAQGYAVFYCNHHGSTGCGETFMRSVLGDWGGKDYQDIMHGVEACIAGGTIDPERMVVTGYSGGGYLTMFIIGHTDRFKAAVPMAGVSNLATFVGTSDIGFWQIWEAKGAPWDPERVDYYRERSPITSASSVTTPTLFIHGESDLRCPIAQSEEMYMALKLMGKVPVELIRAPGAWHATTPKPRQWIEYWEKMLEWFGRYVQIHPEEYERE